MANEIITTLHPDQDPDTNLYPNIKKDNIPDGSIDRSRLDSGVNSLLDSISELHPSGVDTSTNILAFTTNKGIYIGSDTGYWYYWDGTHYVSGGTFISSPIGESLLTLLGYNSYIVINTTNLTITIPPYAFCGYNKYANFSSTNISFIDDNQLRILCYNQITHDFSLVLYSSTLSQDLYPILSLYKISDKWYVLNSKLINVRVDNSSLVKNPNRYFTNFWYPRNAKKYINFDTINNEITIPQYIFTDIISNNTSFSTTTLQLSTNSNFRVLVYNYRDKNFSIKLYSTTLNIDDIPLVIFIYTDSGLEICQNYIDVYVNNEPYGKNRFLYTCDEFSIFKTIGCVGDSLTEGLSQKSDLSYTTNTNLSWVKFLENKYNLTCYNFGKSGVTAKTWYDEKYNDLISNPKCMCYIIGLGYNDHTITGSVSDIDLIDPDNNANTFYGNYAKNIQKIHNYADKSIIFVLTLPYTNRLNSAINSIVDYLNISQVHIIDLNLYIDLFNSNFIKNHMCPDNIHFNPMGYSNISDLLYHILGKYMMDNNDDFVDAPYISYD